MVIKMQYEYHKYEDKAFKIIFHLDKLAKDGYFWAHWHRGIEVLLITEGELCLNCDGIENFYKKGEIALIQSNSIHSIKAVTDCVYYCIIIDPLFCENINSFPCRCVNANVISLYRNIADELEKKEKNYRVAVMGYIKAMMALLSRDCADDAIAEYRNPKKIELVREATQYIYENYQRDISLEDIAQSLDVSKYYLSHIFKESTGKTVLNHLNYVRCTNAQTMLSSGRYTVAQSARANGFSNLSYFSKIYRLIIGNSPKSDIKQ